MGLASNELQAPAFADAETLVAELRPEDPVYCLRPKELGRAATAFVTAFPGDVLYAVKANPAPLVLDHLYAAGIRHFDTASLGEIALVRERFPQASAYFMHPVKGWRAMKRAFEDFAVRHFVVDHQDELDKMLTLFGAAARDLVILVRLKTSGGGALFDLSAKFGAEPEQAAALLQAVARSGCRPGLAFHVGSQCTEPQAYRDAMAQAGAVLRASGVAIACLDVGGGFPAAYAGGAPPPRLEAYMAAIKAGLADLALPPDCRLLCEPGRALVAGAMSLITQIHLRKDRCLYINDGIYGSLFGTTIGINFPARLLRPGGNAASQTLDFQIFGPTCDSLDVLPRPFALPADARSGDWIEFGMLGAYSNALTTGFNGFLPEAFVTLGDGCPGSPEAASRHRPD
jgi:ornithine decarboxylase